MQTTGTRLSNVRLKQETTQFEVCFVIAVLNSVNGGGNLDSGVTIVK